MDCQSQFADFASAFLARDQSAATDFGLRIGRARHSVRANVHGSRSAGRDCPPYQSFLELIRVRESLQDPIVSCRSKVFDYPPKNRIQQRVGVHDVQIQGD